MTRPLDFDVIGSPLDETRDLPMFDAQRVAAPDVAHEVRRAPVAHLEGSGQKARKAARPAAPTSAVRRHILALLLEAHGPLTRSEMARLTGWPKDSCNGRVAEARNLPKGHEDQMYTMDSRGGESLVHLSRLHYEFPIADHTPEEDR